MHRVILVGSPRSQGRCALLADELFNACIEECPEDGVSIVSVASTQVKPCVGCDSCKPERDEPITYYDEEDPLLPVPCVVESEALFHHCVIEDDMNEVRKHLDAADELVVVVPVYFASVPAQLKALLDRLQPYYWTNLRTFPKRPAVVHVVGEGGDPHGFEPLLGTLDSALSVAGFRIELVLDWVGKISADGEITAEADEYEYLPVSADGLGAADEYAVAYEGGESDFSEEFVVDAGEACDSDEFISAEAYEWDEFDEEEAANTSSSSKPHLSLSGAGKGNASNNGPRNEAVSRSSSRSKQSRKPSGSNKRGKKSNGPAYGRKNTKKKGDGHGGRR
jgi:multimeric flavodoxin WrbA